MIHVGIDPGKGGGIAAVDDAGAVLSADRMPGTERDVLDALTRLVEAAPVGEVRAVLELVRSSPQMGVTSAWTFGVGYGGLRMALCAAGIPYDEAWPLRWQNALGCRTRGDKNVSKRRAEELFPRFGGRITHALADALLLAEYGRRVHLGMLPAPPKKSVKAAPDTELF